jgi:hypothetical protein
VFTPPDGADVADAYGAGHSGPNPATVTILAQSGAPSRSPTLSEATTGSDY